MSSPTRPRSGQAGPAPAGSSAALGAPAATVLAWLLPGAAHLLLGQVRKAAVFFVAVMALFVIGCAFGGRLFPFQMAEPLAFLAALAQWGLGLPRLAGAIFGFGHGVVVATTYEYGNTFLITAGLLNMLIVLDANDVAAGRKPR